MSDEKREATVETVCKCNTMCHFDCEVEGCTCVFHGSLQPRQPQLTEVEKEREEFAKINRAAWPNNGQPQAPVVPDATRIPWLRLKFTRKGKVSEALLYSMCGEATWTKEQLRGLDTFRITRLVDDPTKDLIAAFRQKLAALRQSHSEAIAQARKEALEEAAKIVCLGCRGTEGRFVPTPDSGYHAAKYGSNHRCSAWGIWKVIRALTAKAKEQG